MQDSGGPITHDMNSPEIYGTVFSLAPGKKDVNLLWAGSDDGLVHVTRDRRQDLDQRDADGMPDFGRVSQLDGSSFDNGTAYMAVKKMLLGDRSPYIFKTATTARPGRRSSTAFRRTTTCTPCAKIRCAAACSTPARSTASTSRSTTARTGMKFANGLPDVPVTDLVVEDNAIAIGTHGRSFYVMDDIAALRQFGLAPLTDVAVFKPANATRGLDRPIVTYFLKSQPKQLTIDFLDAKGQVVRSITGQPPRKEGDTAAAAAATVPARAAGRADGGGRQPLHVGSQLHRRRDVPRHDPVGRDAERPGGAARRVSGAADRRRRDADAAVLRS